MLNSEKFLTNFNKIERYLRKLTYENHYSRFYALVDSAKKVNSGVRQFETDLKEFADLRNAIVHERTDGHVMAEPNDLTVTKISKIAEYLSEPPKLIPDFQKKVLTVKMDDPISEAVQTLYKNSYSQIPVYENDDFLGLLTVNTISRWLGALIKDDIFSLSDTKVRDVLRYNENKDEYIFLSRNGTIFDVSELFTQHETNGKRLEAILLTQNGKKSEKLLGIITVWDLPNINKKLSM